MSAPEASSKEAFYIKTRNIAGSLSAAFLTATLFCATSTYNQKEDIQNMLGDSEASQAYREVFRKSCEDQIMVLAMKREIDDGAQDRCMNYEATKSLYKDIAKKDTMFATAFLAYMIGVFTGFSAAFAHQQARKEHRNNQPKP